MKRMFFSSGLLVAACLLTDPAASACDPRQVAIRQDATIAFEGDSLTYGFDKTATGTREAINNSQFTRSTSPFPETVGDLLAHRVTVLNRGYPGDRSTDGWQRWAKASPAAVAVLMYGTNDYGNYGGYPTGPVRIDVFRTTLDRLVKRRKAQGASIILMTPPPIENPHDREKLTPFVEAVGQVAQSNNVTMLDTGEILHGVKKIWTDGLHLTVEANTVIAREIASRICVD